MVNVKKQPMIRNENISFQRKHRSVIQSIAPNALRRWAGQEAFFPMNNDIPMAMMMMTLQATRCEHVCVCDTLVWRGVFVSELSMFSGFVPKINNQ